MIRRIWQKFSIRSRLVFLVVISIFPYWLFMSQYMIPLVTQSKLKERQEMLKNVIDAVTSEISNIQDKSKIEKIPLAMAQEQVKALLQKLRYSKSEYVWIHDLDGVMQIHPINSKLNGTVILGMKDPTGKALFKDMNEIAQKDGEGYIEYLWPKPGKTEPVPKISYVRLIPEWKWVVGTGLYIDDIHAEIKDLKIKVYGFYFLISAACVGVFVLLSSSLVRRMGQLCVDVLATSQQISDISQSISTAGKEVGITTESTNLIIHTSMGSLKSLQDISEHNRAESHNVVRLSQESEGAARQGFEQLTDLNSAIQDLANTNQKVIQSMNVIDDIAFQTNLLALNAAVEAARAGDSGRGFAVVAEAVRTLAQKSSEAAKEVRTVTEESKSKTERSVVLAQQGLQNLRDLAESFLRVVEINQKIAKSSDEQSHGVAGIEQEIQKISKTMENFAKSANDTAVDSYELAAYATAVINQMMKVTAEISGDSKRKVG